VSTAATTFAPVPGLSRTKIDRDGVVLRDWWMDEHADATDDVVRAFRTMIAFREAFQLPVNKTVMASHGMYLASVQRRPDSDFLVEFEEARQAMMRLRE
jgi:hypothetical protein